jgi:tetratricopeptide (TPR) repeat protein
MNKIFLFLILCFCLFADDSLFKRGNEEFQNKAYDKALNYYKQIETNRIESASLYFNMGNCYFKLNDIGMAILYFEKAKKLAPNDDDILENLKIANKKVVDYIELPEQMYIFDLYNQIKYAFSIDTYLIIGLFSFCLIFISLFLKKWYSINFLEQIFSTLLNFAIIVFIAVTLICITRIDGLNEKEAVVLVATSDVFTSPDSNTQSFILHQGAKCKITRELNDRFEISLIDGKTGWINKLDVASI